jgi:histidinol-phosphate aminotransferase
LLAHELDVPERLIHINAGSELILRQLFDRVGDRVHLLTPTYPLFPEIARQYTETRLRPEDAFRFERVALLRRWTEELAAGLRALGVRTFPTEAYFFLADFAPHDAGQLANRLEERGILVKPLNDVRLGPGFMRVTTALPEDNARFLSAIGEFL